MVHLLSKQGYMQLHLKRRVCPVYLLRTRVHALQTKGCFRCRRSFRCEEFCFSAVDDTAGLRERPVHTLPRARTTCCKAFVLCVCYVNCSQSFSKHLGTILKGHSLLANTMLVCWDTSCNSHLVFIQPWLCTGTQGRGTSLQQYAYDSSLFVKLELQHYVTSPSDRLTTYLPDTQNSLH